MSAAGSTARLAVVVVSANSGAWLEPCLRSVLARNGGIALDVVVVDAGSTDDTRAITERFPQVRLVACENRGFAHANNRGLETTTAEWVLFLNPDTEIVDGTLAGVLRDAERHTDSGIFGVRQVWPDGRLQYSIRRPPSVRRWLGESLGSESWLAHPNWAGERELDAAAYDRDMACGWVSGSFMLVRRRTLEDVGPMNERYFLYCEEADLSLRASVGGWATRHLPTMTIIHHGGNESSDERFAAQLAHSRRLYMEEHMGRLERGLGVAALTIGYAARALVGGRNRATRADRRRCATAALLTLWRRRPPPFGGL